ncbi:hypothetical protein BJ742DRAFT_745910 [Cladochytrium replicatum]|nr:hypothetical protein BJ742DRAFT_745910 [Cladochytrium replicatum]
MALVADSFGEYNKAMQLLQESLAINMKLHGNCENVDQASILDNIGNIAFSQGDFEKTMQCFEDELSILLKVYRSREREEVASLLDNMGSVAQFLSDFKKAMQYYEESVAIKIKLLGSREHVEVASTLHNMSTCLYKIGDKLESKKLDTHNFIHYGLLKLLNDTQEFTPTTRQIETSISSGAFTLKSRIEEVDVACIKY